MEDTVDKLLGINESELDFTILMAQTQFTFDLGSFDALIAAINAMMNND